MINIHSFYINKTLWSQSCSNKPPDLPVLALPPYMHSQLEKERNQLLDSLVQLLIYTEIPGLLILL